VSFFAKEDIVRKILDNFCDDHETTADDGIVFGHFDVDDLGRDDSRWDESVNQAKEKAGTIIYTRTARKWKHQGPQT